jgi:hypothetical protein
MNFYKLWKLMKEDELSGLTSTTEDDPNYKQQYMKKDNLCFDKSLNIKRKLRKLNYCRK